MDDRNDDIFEVDGELEALEEVDDIITLYDEDGQGVDFQMLDMITRGDDKYLVLYPLEDEEEEDDGSLVILRLIEGEEDDTLESVEDDELLSELFEEFKESHKDEFTFED
ncbi:MAG: DUF1292 domain-containing protein [Clostridia bacterium]|nr:DUF1292 domain-containing protein [Clostridia bacterium]